jgi:hypothetical protein
LSRCAAAAPPPQTFASRIETEVKLLVFWMKMMYEGHVHNDCDHAAAAAAAGDGGHIECDDADVGVNEVCDNCCCA